MRPRATFRAFFLASLLVAATARGAEVLQITGVEVPKLVAVDTAMGSFLRTNGIPRGQLAVARNGKLVFNRAYTWAADGTEATQPTNIFRIASLSKPLTAIGVMRLVENGKIGIDQQIGTWLDLSDAKDRRWTNITVRHLLNHRGGWDRSVTADYMFRDAEIAAWANKPLPISIQTVIDFAKQQPLDFAPGAQYAYANFGFLLLGRIIEKASGVPYERYMQEFVFRPAGAFEMKVGRSLAENRLPGEVDYTQPDLPVATSVFGNGNVPWPYGGFNIDNMDAHGGIVCSAEALARVASSFEDPANSALLASSSIATMWGRPPQESPASAAFYAAGWLVRPVAGGKVNAWHDGSLPGTRSYLVRLNNGITWAVVLNRREKSGQADFGLALDIGINNALLGLAANAWPAHDLFDADGDGFVDSWERAYFGGTGIVGADDRADPDGDGIPDLAEYYWQHDPTKADPGSDLAIGPGQALSLRTVPGRIYGIEQSVGSPAGPWTPVAALASVSGDGQTQKLAAGPAPDEARFFRATVRLRRP